jgi:hypothetical protein
MNRHSTFLELAAGGIDFRLSGPEQARLDAHLAGCPTCRAGVAGLHADARSIAGLPEARLDPRRAASVLDAALHGSARSPVPVLRLALAAALLAVLAVGAALVGSEFLRRLSDDDLSVVPPVPTASPAAVTPTPAPPPLGDLWAQAIVPDATGRPVGRIEAVTAGGPGFVAVGRGCLSRPNGDVDRCEAIVWTSTDGRAWDRAPASDALDIGTYFATSGPEIGMFDVAAGGPGVVAIGYAARPDMQATVWFSPDGVSWDRVALDLGSPEAETVFRPDTRVDVVAWTGERFVVAGVDRSDGAHTAEELATARPRAAVWTSVDGRTWTRVPDGALPATINGVDPAVATGNEAAFEIGGYIDTMEDPSTGGMSDLEAGPSGLVAVGSICEPRDVAMDSGSPGCRPAVWKSPDGIRWDRTEAASVEDGGLGEGALLGSRVIAVGGWRCDVADYPSCPLAIGLDADGTWTDPVPDAPSLSELTIAADRLLAIGAPIDGEGTRLWASVDGLTWSPAAELPRDDASEWRIAAGDGAAVLIGVSTGDMPVAWYSDASVTE